MDKTTQHTLNNGLTLFLKEVHTAPIVSLWLAYNVGSRNEPTGKTGISHWVEHMMFKGTEAYPAGVLDRLVDRIGGRWNAFTSLDCTMYYHTLPAEHIDLALDAEADRMMNAHFSLEDTESERTVIISERQGSENEPLFWLREEMNSVAFRVHGYHHQVIGDMADLHSMTRDDLYEHYQTHYTPANAIMVIVGAFDTDTVLKKVEQYFGQLAKTETPHLFVRPEPEAQGEKRVVVHRLGHTAFLRVAYRTPPATHDDWFKLDMLDSILTGAGGGIDNKTSRLYQALVASGVAAGISGGLNETIDPYQYAITVTILDGNTLEDTERALYEALDAVVKDGVNAGELAKAKKQARAAYAYEMESVSNQAYWIAQSCVLNEPDWYLRYLDRIESVTIADIHDVATRYLQANNRVVGWLVPTGMEVE